jgi:hypothetical protein
VELLPCSEMSIFGPHWTNSIKFTALQSVSLRSAWWINRRRLRINNCKYCNNLAKKTKLSENISMLQKMYQMISFSLETQVHRTVHVNSSVVCIIPPYNTWNHRMKKKVQTGQADTGSVLQNTKRCHVSIYLKIIAWVINMNSGPPQNEPTCF